MKFNPLAAAATAALLACGAQAMADSGPSTTTAPYVQAIAPSVRLTSILTTGDVIGGYKMGGIPDGLGAYDNDDGTFTVLMNHEISTNADGPLGVVRAHGGKGAYVSEWIVGKKTLKVLSGADLMRNVYHLAVDGSWSPVPATGAPGQTSSFVRLCSADLAERSAFYDHSTRRGSRQRIFLNGEESSPTYQRGLAHVATGPDKGSTYVLPWAANAGAAWENLLANPYSGERTVVIGNADGGTNGIYVYVGAKADVGNDVEKAGLIGGNLYRVAVNNVGGPETRAVDAGLGLLPNGRGNHEGRFSLVPGPDTTNSRSTKFLRPEDGAWDKKNHNRYFFVTTDRMDAAKDANLNTDIATGQLGRSRLWALTFKDSSRPELGGSIELLLDGTNAKGDYQMFDNLAVNDDGTLVLQEDVGNNQHNGKVWKFDPTTGSMLKLAGFDPLLFGDIGKTGSATKDEETSGVIDVTAILNRDDGRTYNLLVAQSHAKTNDPETISGGQLLLMSHPARKHGKGKSHDDRDRDRR